jgi:hypothetical protein
MKVVCQWKFLFRIKDVFGMALEQNSTGKLEKSSQTAKLRSSQLRRVFGAEVHFFKVSLL